MSKFFLGKLLSGKGKVFPTIKSVKPTTDISGSVKRVKSKEYTKRIDATNKSKSKIDTGRKMMREGQEELKKMVDTGKAFKFKHGTTKDKTFPIKPGTDPKKEHKGLIEEKSTGGRVGLKRGTPFKKETNVEKIKKTFSPKQKPQSRMTKKKKFPDLTGDGKVTFADILKGRGVINGKKKKKVI